MASEKSNFSVKIIPVDAPGRGDSGSVHSGHLSEDPSAEPCEYYEIQLEEDVRQDNVPLRLIDVSGPEEGMSSSSKAPRFRNSSPESIATLVESLRLSNGDLANIADFDLKRRIKDFRFAQTQRRKRYAYRPYGIIGLFVNLSDTRADLKWAEDAAWRRAQGEPYVRWKDYEKARQQGMYRSYFTYCMIFVCCAMMILAFHWNYWRVEPMKVNPLIGPKPDILLLLGALQMRLMVETNSWYRLVAAAFLHGGILHLLMNMAFLGLMGRTVERNHGTVTTTIIFFVSAIGGNVVSCLMQPGYILVGSSGGLFGLIGMCVADIVLNWKLLFLVFRDQDGVPASCLVKLCSVSSLCLDIVCNSIIGFTPYVDNFAHLGGMIYGFFISLSVLRRLPLAFFGRGNGLCFKLRIGVLRVTGAFIAIALLVSTSMLLSESDGLYSPCRRCRYISCAPFPFWGEDRWWYCDGCDAVNGEVYRRGENEAMFTDLDLFCPGSGDLVQLNISEDGYTDASELQKHLSGYCRQAC